MLDRPLAIPLHRAVQAGGPVLVHGPRLSGKTTLLQREFPAHTYLSLDHSATRAAARSDPQRFLARLRGRPVIIDDLHRAPELIAWLHDHPAGDCLLASSRRQSLPVPTFELHPPPPAEQQRRAPLPLEMLGRFVPKPSPSPPQRRPEPWPNGRQRFLEADLRDLVQIQDTDRFERFLEAVDSASGQILDQQALANQTGISHRTAVRWLAALEAGFLTLTLMPATLGERRLVRRPKLYALGGPGFETRIVSAIYRNARHAGEDPALAFWRDSNGFEIPLLVQSDASPPVPIVIEESPTPAAFARLERWMRLAQVPQGAVIGNLPPASRRRAILTYGEDFF